MSTSGTTSFNEVKTQIIQDTLIAIGVAGVEDTIDSSDFSYASRRLDAMLKHWEADGVGLWLRKEGTLYLQPGQYKYQIGNSSSDHVASGDVVDTTLTIAAISTATTLVLGTVTGMSVNDHLGIIVADGTIFWTTIDAINTGTLTVTIHNALTQAASAQTSVFTYTTDASRPYDVTQIRRIDSSGFEVVIDKKRREDYFSMPNKTLESIPTMWYTDPQLLSNFIYVWPNVGDASYRLKFTYMQSIQDSGLGNNTLDFPQEWIETCVICLAAKLAKAYGKLQLLGAKGAGGLRDEADEAYKIAKGWDIDSGMITFYMNEQHRDGSSHQ